MTELAHHDAGAAWNGANMTWVQRHVLPLGEVLQMFVADRRWPTRDALERHFYRTDQAVDVAELFASKPALSGRSNHSGEMSLQLRHLVGFQLAVRLLSLAVSVTNRAEELYRSDAAELNIRSDDIDASTSVDAELRPLVAPLLLGDYPSPFAGGVTSRESWEMAINATFIREFRYVGSPADFVRRQDEIVARVHPTWGAPEPRAQRQHATAKSSATVEDVAFVIMPFGAEWSDGTYSFIKRAAEEAEVPVRRADEIQIPGRIDDQIVAAIRSARVIIADVTDTNGNVMYELGRADELGKPVVLLQQRGKETPFDIYVRRQVRYSSPPTDEQQIILAAHLRSAWVDVGEGE